MFDLSWSEILIIAIVLIVVVGPKDLPHVLRSFGKTMSKVRSMAGDFRKQFDEAMKEAELEDLKSLADDARKLNPAAEIRKALNPMEQAARDVRAGVDKAMKPAAPISAEKPASTPQPAEPQKVGAAALPEALATKPDVSTRAGKPAAEPVKAAKIVRKTPARANGAAKPVTGATPKAAPAAKKTTTEKARATKSGAAKAKADK